MYLDRQKYAVIVDIDGTVAIPHEARDKDDPTTSNLDYPQHNVIETVLALWLTGHEIIFITSRNEKYRPQTKEFLDRHFGNLVGPSYDLVWETIDYKLYMRPDDCETIDHEMKIEMYNKYVASKYFVRIIFEDRPSCVRAWRELGFTVAQMNHIEF